MRIPEKYLPVCKKGLFSPEERKVNSRENKGNNT